MTKRTKDPRVELVVRVMQATRVERLKRLLNVRDMRRNDGRVRMEEEAAAIITALDEYDVEQFDAAISKARASLEESSNA